VKLAGAAASRYFAQPDPKSAGLLIYGQDAMRVALKRQEVIAALIGPQGEAEMRLARIPAADLRKDPALVQDALKAQGFFPGPRVAFVEDATDALAPLLSEALAEWRAGDATLIVTAGGLTKTSALKRLFEDHQNACAAGLYDDPPTREEIGAELARAGLKGLGREVMDDLSALARALDPGDFRQTLEKIALYKYGDPTPLGPDEVALMAPQTIETEVDDVVNAAADGSSSNVCQLIRRLEGQGVSPVTLCIGALRHFRALHAAASDPGGAEAGVARIRPPIFGPRRDRLARQAQTWSAQQLELALSALTDTDLALRSASRAPQMAVMERVLIRLAMLRRR
jgi:DNA polymerase-3 subunit delta